MVGGGEMVVRWWWSTRSLLLFFSLFQRADVSDDDTAGFGLRVSLMTERDPDHDGD